MDRPSVMTFQLGVYQMNKAFISPRMTGTEEGGRANLTESLSSRHCDGVPVHRAPAEEQGTSVFLGTLTGMEWGCGPNLGTSYLQCIFVWVEKAFLPPGQYRPFWVQGLGSKVGAELHSGWDKTFTSLSRNPEVWEDPTTSYNPR